MRIELPYGNGLIEIDIPGRWEVLDVPEPEPLADPIGELLKALDHPVAGPSLRKAAAGARRVAVSIPDLTRPFPVADYLPAVLDVLVEAGVPESGVEALVATGLHRPLDPAELRKAARAAWGRIEVRNHDPGSGLVEVGTTSRGIPVLLGKRVCEADLVLSMGTVGFHFHAGFGGGPKGIVPGLAGAETIRRNHLLALSGPGDTWHPGCGPGRLAGNPVAEDLLEASSFLPPPVFLVNFVPASSRVPAAVEAGALEPAHRKAARRYDRLFRKRLRRPYDAVIVSAGGHPQDSNLIQAHKAAAHAAGALREGGQLVLVARCEEGLGHPDLAWWFGKSPASMRSLSTETGRKYVQTAYSFLEKARRFRFAVLGEIPGASLEGAGLVSLASPAEACERLREELGEDFRGLVLPGPSVLCTV